jgi:hypothetical protein
MFGRTLNEQVVADGQSVPVIVTKCIEAVEAQGRSRFRDYTWPMLIHIAS